jgi:hypothetical protein
MFPIVLSAVLALGVSVAAASNSIEGVWSFNGGAVGIQALSDGTFQGTVVTPTRFAECVHPAGEVMWTDMQPQTDGSFWGVSEEEGSGKGGIGNGGTGGGSGGSGGGSGGSGSGLITFSDTVLLPNAKACISQTSLKIKLHDPKYDPLTEVLVKINGKKFAVVKWVKRLKKGITLTKLPSGTYKISIVATTVLKQRLSGSQTYKSCTAGSGLIGLKGGKKHHHHS